MKQNVSGARRLTGGVAVLLAIAGIFALAVASLATAGTASAQEVDETIPYCVDGETIEVLPDAEEAFLDENPDATEGACEDETGDGTTDDGTTDDGTTDDGTTDDGTTDDGTTDDGTTDDGTTDDGTTDDGGSLQGDETGGSLVGDEESTIEEEDGQDGSIAGDEATDDEASDAADDEASDDEAAEDDASDDDSISDPDPTNVPQFNTTPQIPLPATSAPADDDIGPLSDDALSQQAGATDETAAASALPSAGSGGFAGGSSAPWGALLGAVLLSLGGAAVFAARAGQR